MLLLFWQKKWQSSICFVWQLTDCATLFEYQMTNGDASSEHVTVSANQNGRLVTSFHNKKKLIELLWFIWFIITIVYCFSIIYLWFDSFTNYLLIN